MNLKSASAFMAIAAFLFHIQLSYGKENISSYSFPQLEGDYVFGSDKALKLDGKPCKIEGGIIAVSPMDDAIWTVSGIKEGDYHVRFLKGPQPYGIYLNGKPVRFTHSSEPVPHGKTSLAIYQTGERLHLRDGDQIRWNWDSGDFLGGLALSVNPLPAPIQVFATRYAGDDIIRLSGDFAPHSDGDVKKCLFKFDLRNMGGRKDSFNVSCRVTDYFQKEIAVLQRDGIPIENGASSEFELAFAIGGSERYSAQATVESSSGERASLFRDILSDDFSGPRKKMWLDNGWEWFSVPDDGTLKTRTIGSPADFKEGEKWNRADLPFRWQERGGAESEHHVAWFRKKFVVPAEMEGERYFIRFSRAAFELKVFLNGIEIGLESPSLGPLEFEVSKNLLPGAENELIVGVRDRISLATQEELDGNKIPAKSAEPWGGGAGLGEICIICKGKYAFEDVLVKTSFREKRIELQISMPDYLPRGGFTLSNRIMLRGSEIFSFNPNTIRAEDSGKTITIGKGWEDAPLWGPDQFSLLELLTELRAENGDLLDQVRTRFGFRELYSDGMNLVWNGQNAEFAALNVLKTSETGLGLLSDRDDIRNSLRIARDRGCRLATDLSAGEDFVEIADEEGIILVQSVMDLGEVTEAALISNRFWDAASSLCRGMIAGMRNHPSIGIWRLSVGGLLSTDVRKMDRIRALSRKILKIDDSRMLEYYGDLDFAGSSPLISVCVPYEPEAIGNDSAYFPEAAYWRQFCQEFKPGMKVPAGILRNIPGLRGDSPVVWGVKPIIINRRCGNPYPNSLDGLSKISSDIPYQSPEAAEYAGGIADGWSLLGLRDAELGVIALPKSLTAAIGIEPIPDLEINVLQKYHSFYQHEEVSYDLNLSRNSFGSAELLFKWSLEKDGEIFNSEEKVIHFGSFEMKRERILLKLAEEGYFVLRISLFEPGEGGKILCSKEVPVRVHPRNMAESWLFQDDSEIEQEKISTELRTAVFDESGKTFPAFESLVGNAVRIDSLAAENLSTADILVIGEVSNAESLNRAEKAILEFLGNGGNVLLLRQKNAPSWLPGKPRITDRKSAINFSFRQDHPILAGVSPEELCYWYPDHIVAENCYEKPACGNFKVIVEAGGSSGLAYAGLLEYPEGRGRILCSQLRLVDNVGKNPVAFKLLRNIYAYFAQEPGNLSSIGIIGRKNGAYANALAKARVAFEETIASEAPKYRTVLLDAGAELVKADIAALKGYAENGGTLIIHGTGPGSIGMVSDICGSKIRIYPAGLSSWTGRAIRLGEFPETAGLTNFDFFWKSRPDGATLYASFSSDTVVDRIGEWVIKSENGESLLFPSFLARINVGKGKIILDNVKWESGKPELKDICGRILCTIMTNLGVKVGEVGKEGKSAEEAGKSGPKHTKPSPGAIEKPKKPVKK